MHIKPVNEKTINEVNALSTRLIDEIVKRLSRKIQDGDEAYDRVDEDYTIFDESIRDSNSILGDEYFSLPEENKFSVDIRVLGEPEEYEELDEKYGEYDYNVGMYLDEQEKETVKKAITEFLQNFGCVPSEIVFEEIEGDGYFDFNCTRVFVLYENIA